MTAAERALDPQARLQRALDLAYRQLGRRDRTVVELRRHLASKAVEPQAIGEAVAELTRQGYLDDARYARRYAEDRGTLDDWGPERIERKLRAAGVDQEHIDAALAARDGEDEL
ncbi:MAG: regulatory protein RecX, partial [Solirubrobacteraceae bacterium]